MIVHFLLAVLSSIVDGQTMVENDSCRIGGNTAVCIRLSRCESAIKSIKAGNPPSLCGFADREPIVCCPDGTRPANSRPSVSRPSASSRPAPPRLQSGSASTSRSAVVAKAKCKEYAKSVFVQEMVVLVGNSEPEAIDQCVRIEEALIVGGTNAKAKEFPHMVEIGYGERNRVRWMCGGSLISERFVLSAAHCTDSGPTTGVAKWVRLGELDTSTDFDDASPIVLRITNRYNHPDYKKKVLYNDIALYELETNVEFNAYIRPICLKTSHKIREKTALATGWGHTKWGGEKSDHLQKIRLDLVSANQCNTSYPRSSHLRRGILEESMLCAGGKKNADTCKGDSGGPLQIPLDDPYCMYELVGVTSFGKQCGSMNPAVYSRVSYFLPWIQSIVWP